MSRAEFMRSLGATCKNDNWSWSFIDERNKRIIFGAWEDLRTADGKKVLILSKDWQVNAKGRKKLGFSQSLEHIEKVLYEGYNLFTFSQTRRAKTTEGGAAKIKHFEREIVPKYLTKIDGDWYATDEDQYSYTPDVEREYYEGEKRERLSSYYERDPKARKACLDEYGYICRACDFNFEKIYGELGKNYIQVHHIKPLHKIGKRYKIDPINDLVPLCANCHVMIHIGTIERTIEDLRKKINKK
jgi:Predicted restriction endonuclease